MVAVDSAALVVVVLPPKTILPEWKLLNVVHDNLWSNVDWCDELIRDETMLGLLWENNLFIFFVLTGLDSPAYVPMVGVSNLFSQHCYCGNKV